MKESRKSQLEKSRIIFNRIEKEGIYNTELIEEGYKLLFPDKDYPSPFQARKEFMAYHYHMFNEIFEQLDELFEDEENEVEDDIVDGIEDDIEEEKKPVSNQNNTRKKRRGK